jgi:predicted RNase H-like HicB family nuclease
MKTYSFRVVLEPDEDRWLAYCPVLEKYAATTWGNTSEEALQHIQEVVQMVVQELVEDQEEIPVETPSNGVDVSSEPRVAVTV